MDKNVKDHQDEIKASVIKNNISERDEDEMPNWSGAVLHVLSSNGLTNCENTTCSVLQKGRIIINSEMGKKNNSHSVIVKQDQKMNGLDDDYNRKQPCDCEKESKNHTTKIQNGGPEVKINGFNSSPESSPVKAEEQHSAFSKPVNGNVKFESRDNRASPKNDIVRPKSISWSRMVKQRKENKMKERNGKRSNKPNRYDRGYIYPELCSSSEESSDENVKSTDKVMIRDDTREKPEQSIKSLCNQSLKLYGNTAVCNDNRESLVTMLKPLGMSLNGENQQKQTEFAPLGPAPLAVAEDSDTGRSSISSSSDGRSNDCIIENNITESQSQENLQTDSQNCDEVLNEDHNAMAGPSSAVDNVDIRRNILPLFRNPSVDSLEEIGDYIETDFPTKASRHLFQSSSRSSSPSTDDEDEGYRVSKEKDSMQHVGDIVEQSYNPMSCRQNSPSRNSENLKLKMDQNVPSVNKPNFDSVPHRIARLSSGAGSESEKGGVMGSDSSYVYTPETDYQDFLDSDLPSSEANNNQYVGNNERDYMIGQLENYAEEFLDSDSNIGHNTDNHFVGAEGGATNNLNVEGRRLAFDYIDSNMEVYDPHCDQPDDDNYLLRVIYKHEKVPIANFQNSESNQQEKIFCKLAFDGENQASSLTGSSDEEENAFHHFSRDVQNLASESQSNDSTDCMGVEDLENLTHALQNAVIMHLPSQLEESSGESSEEEPIYEEIDNLDSFLSTSDNSLHVVDEEPGVSSGTSSKVNTLPKYERRRHRGKRSSDVDKVMIWNEYEAYVLQVKQIGTSACGPTAVLNILKAFDYQVDKEEVCKKLATNLRMEAAPIPYYLFSRYNAGTTADALIDGVNRLTKGTVRGRFFHFYPARKVELLKWLGYWMRKGAVPLATLNLQRGVKPGWTIPDAWHHQMVYGVSSKGVYLTNPLEIVPEEILMDQLTSDSVLLIRRQDVVNRFRDWAPLNEFLKKSDKRWQTMNVLGQVVNVLREACTALSHQGPRYRAQLTSHITIPAAYKAGITLFVRQNTEVCQELFNAEELELKNPEMMED